MIIGILVSSRFLLTSSNINGEKEVKVFRDTCIGSFLMEEREGLWQCWQDQKYYEYTYHKGRLNGVTRVYKDSSKINLLFLESYVNGKREGVSVSFHNNGMPSYVTSYNQDRYEYDIRYNKEGLIAYEGGYVLDSIEEEVVIFDSQTLDVKESKKEFSLSEVKDGVWKFYDNKGRVNKKYYYTKGDLVDSLLVKN